MFTLTDSAKAQIVSVCNKENSDAVRFSIKGGGCSGFEYNWEVVNEYIPELHDRTIDLEDSRQFVVDNISINYIAGATIDFVTEVMGSSFQVSNPNASSSCGCGESVGFGEILDYASDEVKL
jgi:iron-sulfur cluster assembly accessory protein|tara:strand:+ start:615 stop:980 length:366 start_codon:yes stop_codon:yes gene_type:complete